VGVRENAGKKRRSSGPLKTYKFDESRQVDDAALETTGLLKKPIDKGTFKSEVGGPLRSPGLYVAQSG